MPAAIASGTDGRVAFCARVSEGAIAFDGATVDVIDFAVVVAAFASDGKPLWVAAPAIDLDAECLGIIVADDGTVLVAVNTGAVPPIGEVIALRDGKVSWRVTVPKLLQRDRGTATAIGSSGTEAILATRSRGAAALVTLDSKTGAAKGIPIALGDMHATDIAVGRDIYVVGDTEGNATVRGQLLLGRGKKDVVVVAVPR